MKFLIWFGCFFLNALITMIINGNGIILGGIPTALLFLGCYFLAKFLCKKWDNHKTNKLNKKKNNDKLAECFVETPDIPCDLPLPSEIENQKMEQNIEFEQHFEQEEIVCIKCGSPLLPTQSFCSHCGKKIKVPKPQKEKTTIKKKIKKIFFITIAIILVGFMVAGIWAGVVAYQEKQDSYDLTTGYHSYNRTSWAYSYIITNTEGKTLTESYLLYENYYINMVTHGDVVYVSEKGIYEINDNKLITQTEEGQKTEYVIYDGFFFKNTNFYDKSIPKTETFDLELIKDFSDGTKERLMFKKDGTYTISNSLGTFKGKYTRDGFLIKGVSNDITGSRTWLIYKDKLTDSFFEQDRGNTDRLRYEFFKYLKTKKPDEYRLLYYKYINDYEEQHPITIK